MFLEDYESELTGLDVEDYVDHTEGDLVDFSDDDGRSVSFEKKAVELKDPSVTTTTLEQPFTNPITSESIQMPAQFQAPAGGKVKKTDIARAIYDEEKAKGSARKVVIARFIAEAGLTTAGAATYYNNFGKK